MRACNGLLWFVAATLLTGCSSDRQALFTVHLRTIERVSALEPREIVKRGRLAPLNVRSLNTQSPNNPGFSQKRPGLSANPKE